MASIQLKSPSELAAMRQAGRILAQTLKLVEEMTEPGVSTVELDCAAERFIESQNGKPAFKGYRGFPACLCTCLNEQVVHGIPSRRKLRQGDLLKVDCGVLWDGLYADAAVTLPVGSISEEAHKLLETTRRALAAGIAAVRAGARVADVSAAVQRVAEEPGFSVVRDYTGHGIGRALHEEPKVPNMLTKDFSDQELVLEPGVALAIEPMVNAGTHRTRVLRDGWTVVTRDGKLSAHFEHTVAIEEAGPVILTLP
jgi:methionyl aminopeptidase